jgi:hypothetical protein
MRLPVSVKQLGSFIAAEAGGFEPGFCGVAAQPKSTNPETITLRNRTVTLIVPPALS